MNPNFSILDIAKSQDDSQSRLRWVLVDRTPESSIWWPALLYGSHDDLQKSIPCKEMWLQRHIFKRRRQCRSRTKTTWALLFGNDRPKKEIISTISPDKEANSLKHYFQNVDWAEDNFGNQKGWRQAFEEVNSLLDMECANNITLTCSNNGDLIAMGPVKKCHSSILHFSFPMSHIETIESREMSEAKEIPKCVKSEEFVTNSISSNVSKGDRVEEAQRSPTVNPVLSTSSCNEIKAEKCEMKEPPVVISSTIDESHISTPNCVPPMKPTMEVQPTIMSETNVLRKKTKQEEGVSLSPSTPDDSKPTLKQDCVRRSSRRKEQRFNLGSQPELETIPSTPQTRQKPPARQLTPSPSSESQRKKRTSHTPLAISSISESIKKDMPFSEVIKILYSNGWTYTKGKGLVNYYYIFPHCTKMKFETLITTLPEGQGYFKSEEALQKYVRERYNWSGPKGRESSTSTPSKRSARRNRENLVMKTQNSLEPKKRKLANDGRGGKSTTTSSQKKSKIINIPTRRSGRHRDQCDSDADEIDSLPQIGNAEKLKAPKGKGKKSESSNSYYPKTNKHSPLPCKKSVSSNPDHPKMNKKSSVPYQPVEINSLSTAIVTSPVECDTEDDPNITLKDKLSQCMESLRPSFMSNSTMYDGSNSTSKFTSNKNELIMFLEKCFRSYHTGENAASSAINLCGGPGTGKTTLVQHCIDQFSECSEYKCTSLFLNATAVHSPSDILSEIAKCLGEKDSSTCDVIGQALQVKHNRRTIDPILILALDEINFLLKDSTTKDERLLLSTIFTWASKPSYRLILIGISNSVGNTCAKRLHSLIKFEKEIIFEPYTQHDMVEIVKKRLGKHVSLVDSVGVTYLSKKMAKDNGDARSLLEIMSNSVTQCKSSMTNNQLNEVGSTSPVIKLKHVMCALKESGQTPYAQIIADLPQTQKVVLCIAMALSQVSSAWKTITLAQLRYYCTEASNQEKLSDLSMDSLKHIVGALEDAGLLKIGEGDGTFGCRRDDNPYEWTLSLGAQLEDVDCALGETLLQQDFYKRLSDYARKSNKDNI